MKMQMRRGIGYCLNPECEQCAKGSFLLNHEREFKCQVCNSQCRIVEEKGQWEGKSAYWKEVRVEYDYDPLEDRYRSIAIVTDNALVGEHKTFTLCSPLIRTEKRASVVAERLLATLQGFKEIEANCIPQASEKIVHFDGSLEEVKRELDVISKSWGGLQAKIEELYP